MDHHMEEKIPMVEMVHSQLEKHLFMARVLEMMMDLEEKDLLHMIKMVGEAVVHREVDVEVEVPSNHLNSMVSLFHQELEAAWGLLLKLMSKHLVETLKRQMSLTMEMEAWEFLTNQLKLDPTTLMSNTMETMFKDHHSNSMPLLWMKARLPPMALA